jgi:hypothetical protein
LFGLGALVLVAAHSVFDFSLQIPAIALQFAVIVGLATAQSYPSQRHWELPQART